MKPVRIVRRVLPPKIKKIQRLETTKGQLDYLGQLLVQWGYRIPEGARFPSDLQEIIPYLTTEVRGRILDSSITLSILALDPLPRDEQERRFKAIMASINYEVEYV
jgi:hypothetical protein